MKKWNIHLIRHGQTEGNVKKLYYGNSDLPLTSDGIDELKRLVKTGIYPNWEKADMYTSGLLRTEQTFALIYGEREHGILEEFKELHFGEFEMKTHDELLMDQRYTAWIEDEAGTTPPPGGESFKQFADRVEAGFEKLKHNHKGKEENLGKDVEHGNSIVVCHGGVIGRIMAQLFQEDKNFYKWLPETGHGYTIAMEGEEPVGYKVF